MARFLFQCSFSETGIENLQASTIGSSIKRCKSFLIRALVLLLVIFCGASISSSLFYSPCCSLFYSLLISIFHCCSWNKSFAGLRFYLISVPFLPALASTDFESKETSTKLLVAKRDVLVGAKDFDVSVATFVLGKISPKLLLAGLSRLFSSELYFLRPLSLSSFLKVLPVESEIMSKSN